MLIIDYKQLVQEFHDKYGHYSGKLGVIPLDDTIMLRENLILEEAKEYAIATQKLLNDPTSSNIIDIADAIADLLYVTFGAAIAYGIPIEQVFLEVHRSNMSKSTEKNIYGKTIKGKDYEPPKIAEILQKAMK